MRLLLLGCELLLRELCDAILRSPHLVEAQFLSAGLHEVGAEEMRRRLQAAIDAADPARHDAIVLGYALCGTGLAGLRTHSLKLVLPRAHDCITLLLGSRSRYQEFFEANPGVYYRSVGWVERADQIQRQLNGMKHRSSLEELVAQYGESNGAYLYEEYRRYEKSYSKLIYIQSGLEPDESFIARARMEASSKQWDFAQVQGDLTLVRRLLSGHWDQDFLIIQPGYCIEASYDEGIVTAVPIPQELP
jgi:hypothetical protein